HNTKKTCEESLQSWTVTVLLGLCSHCACRKCRSLLSGLSRPSSLFSPVACLEFYQVEEPPEYCKMLFSSCTANLTHLRLPEWAGGRHDKMMSVSDNYSVNIAGLCPSDEDIHASHLFSSGEAFLPLQTLFAVTSERKEFTFNLANALYLQEGFMVKEQYLHSNKAFFQTAVKLVNFQDTKASAEAISTWVENKTDGKIRNLVASDDLGPLTRLLLVNALYFKGNWKQKFQAERTHLVEFTKSDGSVIKTPMMHIQLTAKLGHYSKHKVSYQILELPYKGEEFSLLVILPGEEVAVEEVEKLITAELIKDWFAGMEEDEVEISLPRFKIEQTVDLKDILQPLNVTEIFNNGCDLSGITESADVHLSKAIQKVGMEINEEGSEAAASAGMHVAAIMSMSRNQFVANRPFLFILKHNYTGELRNRMFVKGGDA
ncbi:hypothetical protein lerEdw1_016981, partial [Lerista edwardsae]